MLYVIATWLNMVFSAVCDMPMSGNATDVGHYMASIASEGPQILAQDTFLELS
jgi:hypothetical protein